MSCELCRSLHAACCSVSMQRTAVGWAGEGEKKKCPNQSCRAGDKRPCAAALIELRSKGGETVTSQFQTKFPAISLLFVVSFLPSIYPIFSCDMVCLIFPFLVFFAHIILVVLISPNNGWCRPCTTVPRTTSTANTNVSV